MTAAPATGVQGIRTATPADYDAVVDPMRRTPAMAYREGHGWRLRTDILRYSFTRPDYPNA